MRHHTVGLADGLADHVSMLRARSRGLLYAVFMAPGTDQPPTVRVRDIADLEHGVIVQDDVGRSTT